MDRFMNRYGKWALIAGAAEGIGEGFATFLSGLGMNLVMVDNNLEAMRRLKGKIQAAIPIQIRKVHIDLSSPEASDFILHSTKDLDCRLLIYVAAYSKVKPFVSSDKEELDAYLRVNSSTPLHLVHGFASRLHSQNKGGGIILISSLAGLLGPPLVAPYAATKGFLIRLAESLSAEFRPLGIDVLACCAGLTATPTYLANTPERTRNRTRAMDPKAVAEYAIRNLGKKAICIPGWQNRINFFLLLRLLPHSISLKLLGRTMRKMYH